MIELRYRPHDSSDTSWRVWRTDWGGDTFAILSPKEFTEVVSTCRRFSIPIHPAEED